MRNEKFTDSTGKTFSAQNSYWTSFEPLDGYHSHTEGCKTQAYGQYSRAEGRLNAFDTLAELTNAIGANAEEAGLAMKNLSSALSGTQIGYTPEPSDFWESKEFNINTDTINIDSDEIEFKKPTVVNKSLQARLCLAMDTEENWRNSNRILLKGEIALVTDYFGRVHARVGVGDKPALECPVLSLS